MNRARIKVSLVAEFLSDDLYVLEEGVSFIDQSGSLTHLVTDPLHLAGNKSFEFLECLSDCHTALLQGSMLLPRKLVFLGKDCLLDLVVADQKLVYLADLIVLLGLLSQFQVLLHYISMLLLVILLDPGYTQTCSTTTALKKCTTCSGNTCTACPALEVPLQYYCEPCIGFTSPSVSCLACSLATCGASCSTACTFCHKCCTVNSGVCRANPQLGLPNCQPN
jgi:hypothetical protein